LLNDLNTKYLPEVSNYLARFAAEQYKFPTTRRDVDTDKNKLSVVGRRRIKGTKFLLAATLRWFMAGGAIRIALRQLLQNRK